MDALAFDQLHPEIEERRQDYLASSDTEAEIVDSRSEGSRGGTIDREAESVDSRSDGSRGGTIDREYYVASDLATGSTVPVAAADNPIDLSSDAKKAAAYAYTRNSTSSSSSSSDQQTASFGSASLYQPEFMAPKINYERENDEQKLIAVIGREFDRPNLVASELQKLVAKQLNSEIPEIKFVPFTLRRKVLLRGSFDSRELKKHDLICMCYNASEARILLTGTDGFYTSLLKHVESLLGPNKVAFLISHYATPLSQPEPVSPDSTLISPSLRTRLHNQQPLRVYLDATQVLSWNDEPAQPHVQRLTELANSEPNPQSLFTSGSCCLL